MPTIPNFIDTIDRLKELHKRKNDDYSGDNGPFFNFEFTEWLAAQFIKQRDRVYATMVGIKLARLVVLLNKNGKAQNEPVEDTFDDLIVYCTIWKCSFLESRKNVRLDAAQIEKANTV